MFNRRNFLIITLLSSVLWIPQISAEMGKPEAKKASATQAEKNQGLFKKAAQALTGETPQKPSGWVKKVPDKEPAKVETEEKEEELADDEEATSEEGDFQDEGVEEEAGAEEETVSEDGEETVSEETATEEAETEEEEQSVKDEWALPNPGDWEPFLEMDSQFFPSFMLSTAIVKIDPPETPDPSIIGDNNGLAGIGIRNPAKNTRVRLEIKENLIMEATKIEAVLEKENEIYFLCPPISFKYNVLLQHKQPMPLNFNFSVSINGKEAMGKPKTALIRSINDCPTYYVSQTDDSQADISFMFAAYVNESHPMIDTILQEALKTRIVTQFTGYQTDDAEEVINQVYAIWTALQKRGIKYSSITTPSAHSETVYSQNVRFIEESLNFTQANCVDGSVLLASVLYKIGITPVLVIVPGHMYLGFYLDEKNESIACLETTMLSEGKGEEFFHGVMKYALKEFEKDEEKFIADNDPDYQLINIQEARQVGIVPIAFTR